MIGHWVWDSWNWVCRKLNRLKNSDYLAQWALSWCAEWSYSKFLWSVKIKKSSQVPSSQCLHSPKANLTTSSSQVPMSWFPSPWISYMNKFLGIICHWHGPTQSLIWLPLPQTALKDQDYEAWMWSTRRGEINAWGASSFHWNEP